jgi:hypothetical protein
MRLGSTSLKYVLRYTRTQQAYWIYTATPPQPCPCAACSSHPLALQQGGLPAGPPGTTARCSRGPCQLAAARDRNALRVVPLLDQAVPHGVGCRHVGLQVIKLVPRAGHGVLHVVDDGLLDGQHVVLDVSVHQRVQQLLTLLAGARHRQLGAHHGGGLGGGGGGGLQRGAHRAQLALRHLAALHGGHPEGVLEGAALAADVGLHHVQPQIGEG